MQPVIKHDCPENERLFLVERARLNAIEKQTQTQPALPNVVQLNEQALSEIRKLQIPLPITEIQSQAPPTQTQKIKVVQVQSNNSQHQVLVQAWKSILSKRDIQTTCTTQMQASAKNRTEFHVAGESEVGNASRWYEGRGPKGQIPAKNGEIHVLEESNLDFLDDDNDNDICRFFTLR